MSIIFKQGTNDYPINPIEGKDGNEDCILSTAREKIKELFNLKNVNFLFGSGTSCNAIPCMKELHTVAIERIKQRGLEKKLERYVYQQDNLEDLLGVLYSKRVYLEHVKSSDKIEVSLNYCKKLIEIIENVIFEKINVPYTNAAYDSVLNTYRSFYRKMALRNKDLARICVFTTNNDLFNERAMDIENIHYINGFSGGLKRFFNPAMFNYTYSKRMDTNIDRYEPTENMVYLYKIHGSINWKETDNENSFFNICEVGNPSLDNPVLIYPTPTKQNKSLGTPYVDLFREFQHKLLLPHSVLFVIGYSFSDEHVNDIIYRALATNSTLNLFIINEVQDKNIAKVNDNRIFHLYGEIGECKDKKYIHYFEYIVENLLPDVNVYNEDDNVLKKFLTNYREFISVNPKKQ